VNRRNRGQPTEDTEVIYGLRAGLAVCGARPDDVRRVAYAREVRSEVAGLLRSAAVPGRRLTCAEAPPHELARMAQSQNHEGLCVVARPRRWASPADVAELLVQKRGAAIALDRVRNPYNVGAILRTAAFFGIDAALLGAIAPHPALAPDAVRVAEGGAERILLSRTTDLADTLSRLRARKIAIVGADGHADTSAIGFRFTRPALLVLGHEREGLGPRVRAQCDAIVSIPGTGAVESLNVAVAAGVLMAEVVRGT